MARIFRKKRAINFESPNDRVPWSGDVLFPITRTTSCYHIEVGYRSGFQGCNLHSICRTKFQDPLVVFFPQHRQSDAFAHQYITPTSKMNSTELTASLRFLSDAGHLLATTVPETSAYLMSRRNDLMFEHELTLSDKHRQHICSCCGHIMLLGQGSGLQVKAEQKARQKSHSSQQLKGKGQQKPRPQTSLGPIKVVTCGHCGRLTNVKLPTPPPITRRKAKADKVDKASRLGTSTALSSTAQEPASQKTTPNASSKKRAKSRKAGLQALLSQSSASRNSGPGLGLSLADFMQR